MSEYIIKGETLTGIADAIRAKDGTTEPIPAGSMAQRIIDIPTGNLEAEAMLAGIVDGTATELVFPSSLTYIKQYTFQGCVNLETITGLENVTECSMNSFYNCRALKAISLPNLKIGGSYCFQGCTQLTELVLPKLEATPSYMVSGCRQLEYLHLASVVSIAYGSFMNCSALTKLVLSNTTKVATLVNVSAFSGSAIASGTGYIYVPAALIDTYKAATNWSTYAAQFRVLEEYTVDGTVNGELDESKI